MKNSLETQKGMADSETRSQTAGEYLEEKDKRLIRQTKAPL